jgi:26S proteasome regulatory subunit N12
LSFAKQVRKTYVIAKCLLELSSKRGWQIDLIGSTIRFAKKGEEMLDIPKEKLISQSLAYARELEQII